VRAALITIALVIAAGAAGWYVYQSASYGELEQRPGTVARAELTPGHYRESTDDSRPTRQRWVDPSWLVVISWEGGEHEERSESFFKQVQVGTPVILQVRQRLWRGKPSGWSVQTVAVAK